VDYDLSGLLNVLDFVPELRDGSGNLREPSEQKTLDFADAWISYAELCGMRRNKEAGKMPAAQGMTQKSGRLPAMEDKDHDCGAGFQPARGEGAGKMPAPQEVIQKSEPNLTAGSCILKAPNLAKTVQDALLHFEGQRYLLSAWCIMPNHVHLVVTPLPGHDLSNILHSWKSFSANGINRLRGGTGPIWERESFNHMIRSEEHLKLFVQYIEENPVRARLCRFPEEWPFSSCGAGFQPTSNCDEDSCGAGFQPASELELVDPRKLPFALPRSRGELPHIHKEGVTYFVTFRLLDAVILNSDRAGWKPAAQK
jgi:REP element-mobilizing transposase RayT